LYPSGYVINSLLLYPSLIPCLLLLFPFLIVKEFSFFNRLCEYVRGNMLKSARRDNMQKSAGQTLVGNILIPTVWMV